VRRQVDQHQLPGLAHERGRQFEARIPAAPEAVEHQHQRTLRIAPGDHPGRGVFARRVAQRAFLGFEAQPGRLGGEPARQGIGEREPGRPTQPAVQRRGDQHRQQAAGDQKQREHVQHIHRPVG